MRRSFGVISFLLMLAASLLCGIEPNFGRFDGTAVIIDLNTSTKTVFGKHADERIAPCSTFKILNSLIALDSHVVQDENETIRWDGVVREYPFWNQDHSMRTAIAVSTVWFYQELARRVGQERMQTMVRKAGYGNMDTSRTLTDFWLGNGSLEISANEQADFLSKLVRNALPFTSRAMTITKDIMTLETPNGYVLSGKTGSCGGVGWFVGFVQEDNAVKVFAFTLRGEGANGVEAKKIVLDYLK